MINSKKIDVLLSPSKMKQVFRKYSKKIGISKKNIASIKIKTVKKYIDQRSFSLVAVYSLNNKKKIIGTANSDGNKEYDFKINDLVYRQFLKRKPKNYSLPKAYCYIKSLGFFLREYLSGDNFGKILEKKSQIENTYIQTIAEIFSFLQKIKTSAFFIKKGIDFYDIKKNIKILRRRKKREAKEMSAIFEKLKKSIRNYERTNKNKVLVHGDPNPYNFYFEKNVVKIADFGKAHLGDRVSDLASFLSHLEATLDFKISKEKRRSLENTLFLAYQKITKNFDESEKIKLKIYKNYFSLLSISHMMVWGDYPLSLKLFKKLKPTLKN